MKRQMAGFVALVLLVCCVTAALAEQKAAEAIDENDRLIVLNTAKIMGYTDEQLAQVTVQEKRTDQDDLDLFVFVCPETEEFETLRTCTVQILPDEGNVLVNRTIKTFPDDETYKSLSHGEKVKRMLLAIQEKLPWLCTDEPGDVYTTYFAPETETQQSVFSSWKQLRVYKTGLEHPLSGKIVWVSYLPAVEMVSTVEIIPFQ